ncbi:isochorismatase family protein [Ectothiorhodospira mobilis]|uniref:isochorismatase family protein n=1 Tax=Ectothiorhodospira mobilis TaxID=195064 RepID=UPI001EE91C2D|nr:isochorismatase family protein [Ectothiorhodospira mobilis]MCG5534573.1 isochorismatase family protein [Ectothiorhodospira mobilis]
MDAGKAAGVCDTRHGQLLVVDIQERLASAMAEADRARVCRTAAGLARAAATLEIPVTVTEQYPQGIGATEAAVKAALPDTARLLEKTAFSCCGEAPIMERLQGLARPQVVLCGMEAHVCILQTALGLLQAGFAVFVVQDGVCSRDAEHRRNALERMARAGIIVSNYESVLFEWLGDSRHPRFRDLLPLVR